MEQIDEMQGDEWLRRAAAGFDYPATPDVRVAVAQRIARRQQRPVTLRLQPMWMLFGLVVLVGLLLLVPQVRASVLSVLRAGGITIFVTQPTPAPQASSTATQLDSVSDAFLLSVTPVAPDTARAALGGSLLSSSREWGEPDLAYVDELEETKVGIVVWQDVGSSRYTLYALRGAELAFKQVEEITPVRVRGMDGVWVDGPHGFSWRESSLWDWQAVGGAVLIWWEEGLTYRLEGAPSLQEAQRFAEGLVVGQ